MKNFLVFAGQIYYPGQGMKDFQGSFDTIEEAREALEDYLKGEDTKTWKYDYGQIYSIKDSTIVEEK